MKTMGKIVRAVLLPACFLTLLPGPGARSQERPLTVGAFGARLDSLLADPALARASVGISIVRAEGGSVIADINSGKLFHPASNMKLLTAAAALSFLPGGYLFRTEIYADGAVEDSILRGDLMVRGGGDPLIDTLEIDSLAALVKLAGISRVGGDLVGDVTLFDSLAWGKGWMWDDEPDPDEAFISPLTFHDNAVSITVSPGPRPGESPAVTAGPVEGYVEIVNLAATTAGRGDDSLSVRRIAGTNRVVVEGRMSLSSRPREFVLSVSEPALYFLHALRSALGRQGIPVGGKSRTGVRGGRLFVGRISTPVAAVIRRLNKVSSNLGAENLLKIMGAESAGPPGSAAAGLDVVGAYLAGLGIDPRTTILADGSGVSWYNAVTPEDIVRVLLDQYHRKESFGVFFGSLPVGGVDGTLKTRLGSRDVSGRIFAKTGTITGVSTLSGYAFTRSQELLAFSIMINHYPGKVDDLRTLQDRILASLVLLGAGP